MRRTSRLAPSKRTHPLIEGMLRAFDLFGARNQESRYHRFDNAAQADAEAMRSDWERIGQDYKAAARKFEKAYGR